MSLPDRIVFASHNPSKLAEVRGFLDPLGIEVFSAGDFGLPEPEETGTTFLENARIKAHAAAAALGCPAIADDSGLSVDALGGAPGVYTAGWSMGPDGKRDGNLTMSRIREAAEEIGKPLPSPARLSCCLVLAWPDGSELSVMGITEGTTVWPPRGTNGFGVDPMFQPIEGTLTFAEMSKEQKANLSHRGRAWRQMIDILENLPEPPSP